MPTEEGILGFSNRWYREAIGAAREIALRDDLSIRLVTAPYFISTKYEAFIGRGRGDYLASHDFEDLMAMLGLLQGVELPMSKADRIKEALGWLKVVFAALVAVDVALIAWLAQNFQGAENVLVILALVAVVFTTGAIVGVNHAAYRRISELENL